jgi:hypothetical protein
MEGLDVPLGMVPQTLSAGREKAPEEDGCMSPDILLLYVYVILSELTKIHTKIL